MIIAIDPGDSGGIAWDDKGTVRAVPMPEGLSAIGDKLREIKYDRDCGGGEDIFCLMERTGTYMPGNSGPASVAFARHCGNLEGMLYILSIPTEQIAPSVWQKRLGTFSFEKPVRKREIKEMMARRYPHLKVTLKTADALGILTVARALWP